MYDLSSALAVGINNIFGFFTLDCLSIYFSTRLCFGFLPNPPPPMAIISPKLFILRFPLSSKSFESHLSS